MLINASIFSPSFSPPSLLVPPFFFRFHAADTAELELPTRDSIKRLPAILGEQFSQFNDAARDVLIAASLGATYDRHADVNADREAVRRQLERYRLSDTPLTVKAIDDILEGTDYQVAYAGLKECAAAPEDPLQCLALAAQAVAPTDGCDPYSFIKKLCGCSTTNSRRYEGFDIVLHQSRAVLTLLRVAARPCVTVCLVAVRVAC